MKRIFGLAMLALPLASGVIHANGWPFNIQMSGNFTIQGSNGRGPQAGPWYLYWPLEAHFVAPAPTGYPYWSPRMGLPATTFGGPACPPGVPVGAAPPAAYAAAPPAAYMAQRGYAPQGAYASQGGYAPQGAYAPQGGYAPQGAYAPQGGYAPQAMAGQQYPYAQQAMPVPQGTYPPQAMSAPLGVNPPPISTIPAPGNAAPQSLPQATPQLQLPPYLQPTSYVGQPPDYWFDR